MKKIIFSVALLSAGMMFTSCSEDLLDQEKKGVIPVEAFYQTDEDAESARTAMYAKYTGEIAGTEGIWNSYIMGLNYSADDVFAAGNDINDHADFRVVNEMTYSASSAPIRVLYSHLYKAIYSANLIITNVKPDSEVKKRAIAEARVLRAWAHMVAAQVYYQPPLIDHIYLPGDVITNDISHEEILKWCASEAEAAAADLPERKSKDDKEGAWIVTKGFAQFVAAKSALFLGDYQRCANDIKPLVESDKYALVPGEKFRDLFHVEGDGCSEKIFEFNFTANTALGGTWGGSIQRGRWMVANVLNWRSDDIEGGGESCKLSSNNGWGGGSINQDFAHKMLDNDGDSYRRKATFLTSDEFFYDGTLCPWKQDVQDGKELTLEEKKFDPKRGIKKTAGSFSRSDVMEIKMMMHPNDAGEVGNTNNNTNMCIARLAEAYLIYAEACIQTNQLDEAKKYINKIQERAGSKTISETVNMQVLQDEKQYELWFEGCRWLDLVRWGIAKQCYDKVLDNIPLQFDEYFTSGGTKPHKLTYKISHPHKDVNITLEFVEGKNEYWPIPQNEIDLNSGMHQVYGAWKK
jgi:hypothetical protein